MDLVSALSCESSTKHTRESYILDLLFHLAPQAKTGHPSSGVVAPANCRAGGQVLRGQAFRLPVDGTEMLQRPLRTQVSF